MMRAWTRTVRSAGRAIVVTAMICGVGCAGGPDPDPHQVLTHEEEILAIVVLDECCYDYKLCDVEPRACRECGGTLFFKDGIGICAPQ